jgi:Flp pilus assembly protein TadD
MSKSRRLPEQRHDWLTATAVVTLALAACAVYWPVLQNGFVNWDDPVVLVDNPHLGTPGVVGWAFSTALIGHFQPLAWLVWSTAKSLFGLSPAAFHGLSLAVHVANGVLVYALTLRLGNDPSLGPLRRRTAGLLSGLIFLLNPMSVEAVAWASAFPYVLSLFLLLLSFLAYLSRRPTVAIALYAVSLLARATALGYAVVLLAVDLYPLKRQNRTSFTRLVVEKVPFAALAAVAAAAEWHSRDITTLREIGLIPRVTMAAMAPFVYAWRTFWPLRLSPVDPLPISPGVELSPLVLGIAGGIAITLLAWTMRKRWPFAGTAWIIYLTLLMPVAGFTPTGLQATADRYMYLPSVLVAIVTGSTVVRLLTNRIAGEAAALTAMAAVVTFGVLTRNQAQYWKTSISLWTRAAELDRPNDIATYNLAIALAEAGREEEAMRWYQQTLALVPDHDLARRNLTILEAARAERNADRLAAAGRADEAIEMYTRVLALDPERSHALAARGILMMRRGQLSEAAVDLRRAMDAGVKDAEVPNDLAFALVETGEPAQAVTVLSRAVADHPGDVNLKHNLARLLATAPDPQIRDGARALRLALEVCDRTANRDPRALDTLSAAYAAVGRFDEAREAASRGAALARELGDAETAAEILAHSRNNRR